MFYTWLGLVPQHTHQQSSGSLRAQLDAVVGSDPGSNPDLWKTCGADYRSGQPEAVHPPCGLPLQLGMEKTRPEKALYVSCQVYPELFWGCVAAMAEPNPYRLTGTDTESLPQTHHHPGPMCIVYPLMH